MTSNAAQPEKGGSGSLRCAVTDARETVTA
jgi:hypothetical protein